MGVPKFYRWISERYPKINQMISDTALLPEFDHLYLDMNGIIHGCTHPSDLEVGSTLSERDMMMGIMHYLDRIITQIAKPKVSVYMAIDGVAPRAKLNQQRSRRYRSARDMAEAMQQQQNERRQQSAEVLSPLPPHLGGGGDNPQQPIVANNIIDKDVFDSNCITPGTEFLARVSDLIRFFIRQKLRDDPLWHTLTVIFSGHDVPGEGEHKIMEHLRQIRSQPNYQPNTRHVMYGQDADLIMLGLVTHEPHFTLLREMVNFNFGGNNRRNAENSLQQVHKFTKESEFQLLHLSLLREYLAIEFCLPSGTSSTIPNNKDNNQLKNNPESTADDEADDEDAPAEASTSAQQPQPLTYDLERCIDDFVFMTFLVGNDFLPHLPTLDIGDGAFDMLFSIYRDQRLSWGQGNYLTHQGTISDPHRFQTFITAIGEREADILAQRKIGEKAYLKKKRRWDKRDGKPAGPSDAELQSIEDAKQMHYQTMIDEMMAEHGPDPDNFVQGSWQKVLGQRQFSLESSDDDAEDFDVEDVKGRYYFEKFHIKPVDKEAHWQLRKSYMEGLMWCLAYYYKGCISWGWYFPYHYGPMLSDLTDIPQMVEQISFELGQPLSPFEQLMACLPPGSSTLVPKLYRWLMTSPQSPIIQFYPENFEVDMNGKKNPWEGVNLLPFIDVQVLKDTIAQHCPGHLLSEQERDRNSFGKVYAYRYDATYTDAVEAPIKNIGLVDLLASCSVATVVEEPLTPSQPFEPRLIAGTQIPFPGFPSLNVLPFMSVEFVSIGLNCFGSPSKHPTWLLTLERMAEPAPLAVLSKAVLGKSLFVNWPMMHEARAVAISDETQEIRLVKGGGNYRTKAHTEAAAERWRAETEAMQHMYYVGDGIPGSGGVNIGEIRIRLKLLPLQGMKRNPTNGSRKKVFGREEADVPLQLALGQAPAPDPRFQERGPMTLKERFAVGSRVVLTKGKYRGCLGEVVGLVDKTTVGVRVQTLPAETPYGLALARAVQESYVSSNEAARILRIHPGLLGKIAGRLQFEQGRYDLGLNLKSADGLYVVGYTRKKVLDNASNKNNNSKNKKSTWAAGDALRVVGSKPREPNDAAATDDRIVWEYAPKAIRLIEAYRARFPQLFSVLAQYPNEKKYDANTVFGQGGESWLPTIREWLNSLESAKLPRSPVTTQSMSYEAVAAVQKASDVRALAIRKKGYPKESFIKIPGGALFREGSTGATDVMLAGDLNNNHCDESPQLGDRILNLAADGIPFGLRGTVVAIHEASTTMGSVEVVMDEEFMGGNTLQGLCSKFRGKLCLWSRLLKVAPDDAKAMVDKMVPKGSGKAAVIDRVMSTLDPTGGAATTASGRANANSARAANRVSQPTNNTTPAPRSKKQQHQQPRQQQQQQPSPQQAPGSNARSGRTVATAGASLSSTVLVSNSATAAPPNGSARAGSSQKGRQAGWREARGPDGNTGFKWKGKGRKGKMTGVMRWKIVVSDNQKQNAEALLKSQLGIVPDGVPITTTGPNRATNIAQTSSMVDSAAEQLKAVLGVSGGEAVEDTTGSATSIDAVSNLKSMLGVVDTSREEKVVVAAPFPPATSNGTAVTNVSDTAQLKVVLGVGSIEQAPRTSSNAAETAADKLLQIMTKSQQQHSQSVAMYPPGGMPNGGFNFTYTTAGSGPPQPPPTLYPPGPPPMFVPPGPPTPIAPGGPYQASAIHDRPNPTEAQPQAPSQKLPAMLVPSAAAAAVSADARAVEDKVTASPALVEPTSSTATTTESSGDE